MSQIHKCHEQLTTWGFKMRTYEADIRIAVEGIQQGTTQRVTIQADRSDIARAMLEAQYGKGCIVMFRDAPNQ